jgi:hypothetical protein
MTARVATAGRPPQPTDLTSLAGVPRPGVTLRLLTVSPGPFGPYDWSERTVVFAEGDRTDAAAEIDAGDALSSQIMA